MDFVYSSGAMGFGEGHLWHKVLGYTFPDYPIITKTLTLYPKKGYPYAIIRIGSTIYNHVAHDNPGLSSFLRNNKDKLSNKIISIAGTDEELSFMTYLLDSYEVAGIQLSFSCPNVKSENNKNIPNSRHKIYLKLNYLQDPHKYDLDRVTAITVNSVPCFFGGKSGKGAQKYNWEFIREFRDEGLDVFGASWITKDDIKYLEEYCGVTTCSIGSVMLINPSLVETL